MLRSASKLFGKSRRPLARTTAPQPPTPTASKRRTATGPPFNCRQCCGSTLVHVAGAWVKSKYSLYFWACILFFMYNSALLHVDFCSLIYPQRQVLLPPPDDDYYATRRQLVQEPAGGVERYVSYAEYLRLLGASDDPYAGSENCTVGVDENCTRGGNDTTNVTDGDGEEPPPDSVLTLQTVDDVRCSFDGWSALNIHYVVWGALQVVNSLMFVLSWWVDSGIPVSHLLALPDWLFVLSSTTWFITATFYNDDSVRRGSTLRVAEMAASVIDALASAGWLWSWWETYERMPGRGFSLDDPDFVALLFLQSAAWTYCAYNAELLRNPTAYDTSYTYVTGDILYFMSGVGYLFAALRDSGFMWWVPLAGGWSYTITDGATGEVYGQMGRKESGDGGEGRAIASLPREGVVTRNPLSVGGESGRGGALPVTNPLQAGRGSGGGGGGVAATVAASSALRSEGSGGREGEGEAPFTVRSVDTSSERGESGERQRVDESARGDRQAGGGTVAVDVVAAGLGMGTEGPSAFSPVRTREGGGRDKEPPVPSLPKARSTREGTRADASPTLTQGARPAVDDDRRAVLQLQRVVRGWRARRLVRGWTRVVDDADGDIYWFNKDTQSSSWFPPGHAAAAGLADV